MSTGTRPRERERAARPEPADPVSGASRAVLLLGITLGTALVVLALWQGARPQLPGMPALLGLIAGVLLMWGSCMALALVAVHLVRLHHRDVTALARRHGKQAALASARGAGRRYRAVRERAAGWAAPRWHGRQVCVACGNPGSPDDPLVIIDGYRVHESHAANLRGRGGQEPPEDGGETPVRDDTEPSPGAAIADVRVPADGQMPAAWARNSQWVRPDGAATDNRNGDRTPMSTDAVPVRNRLPDHVKANAPAGWQALAGTASDFEPESDEALLDWMAAEVAGISTYGEALTDVYETCVEGVRLDPVAMAALHDAADAAGDFATAMAYARQKFASHYAEVREFVAEGGVLPKDGDFITGEGDD